MSDVNDFDDVATSNSFVVVRGRCVPHEPEDRHQARGRFAGLAGHPRQEEGVQLSRDLVSEPGLNVGASARHVPPPRPRARGCVRFCAEVLSSHGASDSAKSISF